MSDETLPPVEDSVLDPCRRLRWIYLMAGLIGLGITLVLFGFTEWDLAIQDGLYRSDSGWLISGSEPILRDVFYSGPKTVLKILGGTGLLVWLFLPWAHRAKRPLIFCLLGIVVVTTIHAGARNITNVHCPREFQRYDGELQYAGFLDPTPPSSIGHKRGRCFPGAHAAGGFCLLGGFFAWGGRWRWFFLAAGLCAGWTMGVYQMAKGAHFLSHTIVSMFGAWILLAAMSLLFDPHPRRVDPE
jgi:membrane-associated PAP2 superfamily phosphatase